MRKATKADDTAVTAFLRGRTVRAMFPLSNLLRHGWVSDHRHATAFWLAETEGRITDVLGLTREGIVMPVLPSGDWATAAEVLAGARINGIVGPAEEARPLEAALGLRTAPRTLDRDEPQFALDLADLQVPEGPGRLCPAAAAGREVLRDWMGEYHREALGTPEADIGAQVAAWLDAGDHRRVLMQGDAPLALTGFNATAAGMVQVGGVFVPPALRGRGHARRAVALHLAEARAEGATGATLFAASPAAMRAYAAIGFRRIGTWTLLMLATPGVTADG